MINPNTLREKIHELKVMCDKYRDIERDMELARESIRESPFDTRSRVRNVIVVDGSSSVLWKPEMYPVALIITRVSVIERGYDPINIKIQIVGNDMPEDLFHVIDEAGSYYDESTGEIFETRESTGVSATPISDKANQLMEEHEMVALENIAMTREGVLIVKDGPLSIPDAHRMPRIKRLVATAEDHGNVIVGITKDSNKKWITGKIKDEIVLGRVSRPGLTGYCLPESKPGQPSFEGNNENKIGTCYARLHPTAMKWYRIDFQYTAIMDLPEILRTIACYSQVNTMPGAFFPELAAHEIAVKVRQLKPVIDEQVIRYLKDEGFDGMDILQGMTDVSGKPSGGTHHDYLDNFTRVPTGAGKRR